MQKAGLPLSGKSSFAVPFFSKCCGVLNKISTKSPSEGTFQHKSLWKRGCCSTFVLQQPPITWSDGRTFPIEKVLEFRPAGMAGNDSPQDIFTVVIRKKEKALYFEHIDPRFTGRLGRWFIKKQAGSSEKAAGDSNKK